jgi:hypothetical protein
MATPNRYYYHGFPPYPYQWYGMPMAPAARSIGEGLGAGLGASQYAIPKYMGPVPGAKYSLGGGEYAIPSYMGKPPRAGNGLGGNGDGGNGLISLGVVAGLFGVAWLLSR